MGYQINEYGEIISPKEFEDTNQSLSPNRIKKWHIILGIVFVFVVICSLVVYQYYNNDNTSCGVFANKEEAIDFITGYYKSVINGNFITYFEDNDITFFDLVRVDKNAILKRLKTANTNVDWDFDWSTLTLNTLSSGTTIAVYSFDYYIHYKTRTDKYHITSEMIISPNRKITSLRDLETIKIKF